MVVLWQMVIQHTPPQPYELVIIQVDSFNKFIDYGNLFLSPDGNTAFLQEQDSDKALQVINISNKTVLRTEGKFVSKQS
jgi:hypothetical protein